VLTPASGTAALEQLACAAGSRDGKNRAGIVEQALRVQSAKLGRTVNNSAHERDVADQNDAQ
jgi:hypothetical protein